jgi:hypothetical protein
MSNYLYDFDDPYKILAHHIVSAYRPADVLRTLTDNSYLKTLIIKEVREQDFGGHFIDCIIENILEEKDRMEYMHKLDELAVYYYTRLDKGRLRDEILAVLNNAGVEL